MPFAGMIPNHPTWANAHGPNAVPSRELCPPPAYPAWIDAPWGQGHRSNTVIPQDVGSLTSALPFSEAMGPDGYNHTMFPSSSNPTASNLMAQQGQDYLLVHQPEYVVNVNATVIRNTISTPAIISSANRRRVHPHKYACNICGNRFTSKANRDRHVRAHYGIKPFICPCGKPFTAKADLQRHRKGRSHPFLECIE